MGLRIGPSMLSTKEQRQRDEQRNGSHKCIQEWEKDQLGCLPTQMTSQFSPLSKTHKSAVTTRTGCQGDTLCLSIKGAACEDYPDLENKQREHRHPSGQNKKTNKQQNRDVGTLWPRPNAINRGKCVTESSVRRRHETRHAYWNGLNLIRLTECSSEGETNNIE